MTVEDEVRAVSLAWDIALMSNNAALVADFMTDEWVYVGPHGMSTKVDITGWITSGRLVHETMTVQGQPRVASVGDAVIVTARKAGSGSWDAAPCAGEEWISEVYACRDGHWRCALSQKTAASP